MPTKKTLKKNVHISKKPTQKKINIYNHRILKVTQRKEELGWLDNSFKNLRVYLKHKLNRSYVGCGGMLNNLLNLSLICINPPVTGRNMNSYRRHLFGDIKENYVLEYLQNKNYLDIGSGLNHLYQKSLLYNLIQQAGKTGNTIKTGKTVEKTIIMGFDTYDFPKNKNFTRGSIYNLKFPDNTFDIIVSQYLLYYWIDDVGHLLKIFRQLTKILKNKGEIRIYPVYFGNYHFNDTKLIDYLHSNYKVEIFHPKFNMEKVVYIENTTQKIDESIQDYDKRRKLNLEKQTDKSIQDSIQKAPSSVSKSEKEDHHNLMAHTLILTKIA